MSILSLVGSGRRLVEATLVDAVIVWEQLQAPDGQGGVITTWVAHTEAPVHCAFGVLSEADERGRSLHVGGGVVEGAAASVLQVPVDTPGIPEGTHLVDVATGRLWQVIGETTPPSARAISRRLLIREL